jgi:ribosomal protein S18 acetylase RimI-like enzyme
VPPSSASTLRRVPFASGDGEVIAGFCAANGGIDYARLLLDLTSGAGGVFVIADDQGIALAATVVDRTRNGANSANLEMLAVRARIPAAEFIRLVVEPAAAFARDGDRRALHVTLPQTLLPADGVDEALGGAGFAHAYDIFEMRRSRSAAPHAPLEPLPPGWSWTALDAVRVDAAHAALAEMFRDALATHLLPLADFRQTVESGAARWRVLLDGDRIAGLIRVVQHGDRGELRILGRVPAYRGRGLGARIVAEGLRELREGGAGDVDLSVEAVNERALGLYRRFGFEIVSQTPVFALTLR